MERGRSRIIVTELPYMTNKASLIERIAELTREGKLEGIADLRDESDRQGMRIVIELSKTADPEAMLGDLYKHTPMQSTFSIIMLALVDGEPRLLSLKQSLRVYIEHRLEVVRRRSQYDLDKARQRAHILEGLRVALKNLDEVIELIRRAPDVETARSRLMKRFRLSEIQAQAILDMPLRRLAALERKKIEEEYKELLAQIKELEALLRSPKKMRQAVSDEAEAARLAHSDRRRTHIVEVKEGQTRKSLLSASQMVPEKTVWLSITPEGLVSHSLEDKEPRLSGKEAPAWLARVSTRDTLYLVCEAGEAAAIPVHAVPENDNPLQGIPYTKVSPLREDNRLAAVFSLPGRSGRPAESDPTASGYVISITRQGMIKKSAINELPGPSANTFTLAKVNENDRLGWIQISHGRNELLLISAQGMAIRFSEDEVRPMGLAAAGVMGMKLAAKDEIGGALLLPKPGDIFMVTSHGKAKRVPADHFPLQGRYGLGVQAWKFAADEHIVGAAIGKGTTRAALHVSRLLPKAIRLDEAPLQTRAARGQVIYPVKAGVSVTGLTLAEEAILPGKEKAPSGGTPKASPRKLSTATAGTDKPAPRGKTKPGSETQPSPASLVHKTRASGPATQLEMSLETTRPTPKPRASAASKKAPSPQVDAAPSSVSRSKASPPKAAAAQPNTKPAAGTANKKTPAPQAEAAPPPDSQGKASPPKAAAAQPGTKPAAGTASKKSSPPGSRDKASPPKTTPGKTSAKKAPTANSETSQPAAGDQKDAPQPSQGRKKTSAKNALT
jgi:DNA gyrase subunit A